MTTPDPSHPDLRLRRAVGASLLAMLPLAVLGNVVVLEGLMPTHDPEATVDGVTASLTLARLGVLAFVAIAVLDVVVGVGLGHLVRDAGRLLAGTVAALRVTYAAVLAVAAGSLAGALDEPGRLGAVPAAAEQFRDLWSVGLGIFGVHLLALALALHRWRQAPRWMAPLVALAGLGYLVDSVGTVLRPDLDWRVSLVTFVGEVVLMAWLLVGGRRARAGRSTVPAAPLEDGVRR